MLVLYHAAKFPKLLLRLVYIKLRQFAFGFLRQFKNLFVI
jgi:hypothetical protein